ncbi:hypothetical protein SS1G_01492 [Sclerotinia sclerotiorum 1980 UF-70]|uniref:Amino acid permease/ SLC12A domain-containing protein n=1 Tax=Sclerotinia sclerotiorum (strain ATCC 18683 / 1980 / Ss-1) TaxID=665079 RepID=A7E864_SCLS1|nr:hypothetical protein SS1G_01492 [Sclerotinia sclerotiorum 1980 UF-70]EDN96566.1 hypothetical protein SS1G_01492 [Sclerotinia sclerotiorum 1980 UF-70]
MGSTEDIPAGQKLKRDMKGRHINMIAIAGMIYTTGEITAFMPVTGGFVRHATAFVEPALGAATGWNFLCLNFCGVRMYGESEVIFASMKIALIIGLIVAGLVVDLGGGPQGERLGFTYWKSPGAFNEYLVSGNTGRFLAFWSSLISAAFSYGNVQVVALSGTETANPRKIIPDATKKTFFRVFFFYVLSILIVGMIVPYDSEALSVSTGTAASSPFVIAFKAAGIKVLPSLINAVVCTSAISSGSACIFLASRTLYGLSADGHAPKIFMKCNRFGTPWYAVGLSVLPSPLVYMVVSNQASVVFGWFVNITTVAGLIGWAVIEVTYLRFFYALKKRGISRDGMRIFGGPNSPITNDIVELPYKSPFQPYVAWITGFMVFLIVFFSGFAVFFPGNFTASEFLTYYINVAIFIGKLDPDLAKKSIITNWLPGLYAFFKLVLKSKVIPLESIDFDFELDSIYRWKETSDLMKEEKNLVKLVWDKIF